jgi:ABC-type amino acid transport system permease subunit
VGGVLLGSAGARWKKSVGLPSGWMSSVLTAIPVLVFLFWLHYPLQSIFNVVIDPFITSVTALSIVNISMVSESVREVLNDFPQQYIMAARVSGLTPNLTFKKIQFPIIFRQVIPGLLQSQVVMLQSTLFASLISVDEIFRISQRINSQVYRPVEIYTTLAIFFLALCLPLHVLAKWLKDRFTRDLSEK